MVDHAEVLRRLKAYIAQKGSHGQRDLLATIGRLEAECGEEDMQYRRFVRRFADELADELDRQILNLAEPDPLTPAAAPASAMDPAAAPSIAAEGGAKEDAWHPKHPPPSSRRRPVPDPELAPSASPSRTESRAPALAR